MASQHAGPHVQAHSSKPLIGTNNQMSNSEFEFLIEENSMPQAFCREKAKENVLFTYLYRDYGNYKKYSQIVFANPDHLSVSQVKHRFEDAVVAAFPEAAENQFRAEALCLPTTYFSDGRTDDDHGWHEYDTFSETDEAPTATGKRSVAQFLFDLECIAENRRAKRAKDSLSIVSI